MIQDPSADPLPAHFLWPLMRTMATWTIFGYTIGLALLFLALRLIGESWWPLAILLYLPQVIFLLPILVLLPAALLAEVSRRTYVALACSFIIFFSQVPFYPGMNAAPGHIRMKVMTNNYATNHGLRLQPFIDAEDPDIMAVEDVGTQGQSLVRGNPGRSIRGIGQFLLISKAPVKSFSLLGWPTWRGTPIAALFVVPWQGEDVAIYAVHLPTPRGDFAKLAGMGFIKELAGRNRRRSDDMSFGEAMTARVQLARDFATLLAREKRPFVAMGDFNMPSDGCVNRILASGLVDCFAQAGRGFGFTFPCDRHNPLTFGGPWMRIDYILGGPGWRTEECRVEPDRRSKHRAVVATISRD